MGETIKAPDQGFEPQLPGSEPGVLPLDESGKKEIVLKVYARAFYERLVTVPADFDIEDHEAVENQWQMWGNYHDDMLELLEVDIYAVE